MNLHFRLPHHGIRTSGPRPEVDTTYYKIFDAWLRVETEYDRFRIDDSNGELLYDEEIEWVNLIKLVPCAPAEVELIGYLNIHLTYNIRTTMLDSTIRKRLLREVVKKILQHQSTDGVTIDI